MKIVKSQTLMDSAYQSQQSTGPYDKHKSSSFTNSNYGLNATRFNKNNFNEDLRNVKMEKKNLNTEYSNLKIVKKNKKIKQNLGQLGNIRVNADSEVTSSRNENNRLPAVNVKDSYFNHTAYNNGNHRSGRDSKVRVRESNSSMEFRYKDEPHESSVGLFN